ncbi:hypothetical protein [Novosphingobium sp. MMS21-SN21R]|uniref:hypothetical protein n=1 Tax=Novosphingobium sp. MMS21-SN21R TaxID=2969298 RepID=UPI002883EBFA|nr:hypothetical protein [Novosphingobium sp. MMS21-SN21R]MDT0508661.1 hypothetical protein [Novosphingobium sp. MMS21-SN21R]
MPNPEITFPGRYTPVSAVAYAKADGSTELVTTTTPMPVVLSGAGGSLEPGGAAVTGATMPTGGTGLTGWLSAIYRAFTTGLAASTNHIGNVFVDDVADNLTITGSATSAATVVSSSTLGFGGGTFQVLGGGTGCTISYEQSNDGTVWVALPVIGAASSASSPVNSTTLGGMYAFATAAAFVRARVSTFGSGTVTIALVMKRRPLNVMGTSLAAGSATVGTVAISGTINPNSGFTDSTAALAASAAYTGTGRAVTSTQHGFFAAQAYADAAGTLFIDQSLDTGTTWFTAASVAVAAASNGQLSVRITGSYAGATMYRVRYVNGAAAQAVFRLSSALAAS